MCGLHSCCVHGGVMCVCTCLRARLCVCVCVRVCVCVCIRRFYCLYGDSMNVAARMSANAKESGVCVSPQIAAHLASAAASRCPTATDVPSEELKRASTRALETASDAGFRGLETLDSTLKTPLHPSLTETRVTSLRDGHSSDVASEELADAASEAHASACRTPRLCVVSRGVHLILSHLTRARRGVHLILSHLTMRCDKI